MTPPTKEDIEAALREIQRVPLGHYETIRQALRFTAHVMGEPSPNMEYVGSKALNVHPDQYHYSLFVFKDMIAQAWKEVE